MQRPSIEDMKLVHALKDLPHEHLVWLQERSEYKEYEDGMLLIKTGDPTEEMIFTIEGRTAFFMNVNGKEVFFSHFENNEQTGGAGGLLPYSRMKSSPGNAYAEGKVRGFSLHKKYFQELEQLNPDFIQKLIGYMTERARHFATVQLQHEKVNALGKLAAGIAHELNNPAAAISRIAAELNKRLMENFKLTAQLLQDCISPEHIRHIQANFEEKKKNNQKKLTALQKIKLEDELNDWFAAQQFKPLPNVDSFLDAGFSGSDLDQIKEEVGEKAFKNVIYWLENLISSERIVTDLDDASNRISNLVSAIKSHVHMDRTNEMQPTDLHKDLENTLTLLGYKLRGKNIELKRAFSENLPEIPAYIGELNQVWTNLIDNAIYAMDQNGKLTIKTCFNANYAEVKIVDNGAGIPKEIQNRIFDPFFTTKKVGEGTGIGLDLVSRIVKRHNGEIKLFSEPGKTEFTVCLPLRQNNPS